MDRPSLFKIVIAYEDFNAGIRATKMTERLAAGMPSHIRITNEAWKFELIESPHLEEVVIEAITDADMLIVAARGDKQLPAQVAQWIQQWTSCPRNEPVALVALDSGEADDHEELSPLRVFLQSISNQENVELFWYGDERFDRGTRFPATTIDRHSDPISDAQLMANR